MYYIYIKGVSVRIATEPVLYVRCLCFECAAPPEDVCFFQGVPSGLLFKFAPHVVGVMGRQRGMAFSTPGVEFWGRQCSSTGTRRLHGPENGQFQAKIGLAGGQFNVLQEADVCGMRFQKFRPNGEI